MNNTNRAFLLSTAAMAIVCCASGGTVQAQTPSRAGAKSKATKSTTAASGMWECQHCKEPMTLAEAKKKGMKCCGMPMVQVKAAKKTPKHNG